jgi:hypothetical protein
MAGTPESDSQESQERERPPRPAVIVRVLRALKRRYHARKRKRSKSHESNERMMARRTRNVGLFTLALVFVGIFTAAIFMWQLLAMQGQLSVMQSQFDEMKKQSTTTDRQLEAAVATERPYVFLSELKVKEERSEGPPTISAVWNNIGKTPAVIIEAFYHVRVTRMGAIPNYEFDIKKAMQMPRRYTIAAEASSEQIVFQDAYQFTYDAALQKERLKAGRLFGEYSYADMFGYVYTQCFRYYFSPDLPPSTATTAKDFFDTHPRFGDIGDDCRGGGRRQTQQDFKARFQPIR